MATLRTAIALYDGVTSPLQHMTTAMNVVINSFEKMQTASGHSIDTAALQTARSELARASTAFDSIENNIRQSDQQQQRFNNNIRSGTAAAYGLLSKIKGYVGAFTGLYAAQKIVGLSDTLAQTNARLNLIVDDGGSVEELKKKIMASANESRASYVDVAKTVSKLGILAGDAFSGNDEEIKFVELMNKNFKIGGAAVEEQSAAMYQLTQAMASGRLQGDEFRSIRENAPLLANAIEDYMTNAGVPGTLKDWSAQGLITADVIKNAMFNSADDVDARFKQIPMTWSDVWVKIKNTAILVFDPILDKINKIANSKRFQKVFNGIVRGLVAIANVAAGVFDIMISGTSWVIDHWDTVRLALLGVIGVMVALELATLASAAAHTILAIAQSAHALTTAGLTASIGTATGAQLAFNTAAWANPVGLIFLAAIGIIAAFIAAVAIAEKALAEYQGQNISWAQSIVGAFLGVGAVIINIVLMVVNIVWGAIKAVWNVVATFGNFLANFLTDPMAACIHLVADAAVTILDILSSVAGVIDTIFGIDSTSALNSAVKSVKNWADKASKEYGNGTYQAVMPTLTSSVNYLDPQSAFDAGVSGVGKISAIYDNLKDQINGLSDYNSSSALGDTAANTADTAANTAAMKDSLASSEEHLKYLREIAERQAIDQYTTAEIHLVMQNENHISSDADLDGIINELEKRTEEAILAVSEGAHV